MRILSPGLVRVACVVTALATVATSCYRYETRDFEITIPEQAESSVVVARDGRHIITLVAPENRTSARTLDEIPQMVRDAVIARSEAERREMFDLQRTLLLTFLAQRGRTTTAAPEAGRT